MAYKKDPIGGMFGEYQRQEYPDMKGMSTQAISRMAQTAVGLGNYVAGPTGQGLGDTGNIEMTQRQVATMAQNGAGLSGIDDDAFAGYNISFGDTTPKNIIKDDEEDEEDEDELDGLGGQEMESWNASFNKASLARTDTGMILALGNAVKAVPDNTPMELRKQYYDLAKSMLNRRKQTDLRHLDMQRAEIESNIGWLVDSRLPKTGGFNRMLEQAVGRLGPELARNDTTVRKAESRMNLGRELKATLRKAGNLAGFGEEGNNTRKLVLMVGVGLAAVAIYYHLKNKPVVGLRKNKKKR